jgi:LPS-assembly lipoprotein
MLGLGGCGFRPLYAPGAMANGRDITEELAAIRVANVQERNGQNLRRALQQRLEDSRPGTPARYELRPSLAALSDLQGYRQDGVISRVRLAYSSEFRLVRLDLPQEELLHATARRFDAFNIPENQFFAADVSRDAAERRLMEGLAEDIIRRLVLEFRRRGEA